MPDNEKAFGYLKEENFSFNLGPFERKIILKYI